MTPITNTAKRYGAYHRVSDANGRDLEAETTMTDKDAFEQMDAWAKSRGVKPPKRYLDWDKKGSTMQRPELDRMLADLDAGVIDGIVVAQVDRLSRAEVGDALTVIKQMAGDDEDNPRPLVLLDLGIDPSTEFGEFGLTILLGLARMQWRRYKRTWATAQKRATKRGVWIGLAPLGYIRNQHGALELDERTWRIVREAFRIAARDGLHAAGAHLARAVPDKRWRTSDVRRILSNRAYLGEHHNGGVGHDPITTLSTWEAAQTDPRARRSNGNYPLSAIAVCANCGGDIVGARKTDRDGVSYRNMRCQNTGKTCRGGVSSIRADRLEENVREQVAERLGNRKFRELIEPAGKDDAEQALELAQVNLLAHVEKVPPTSAAYGPGVVKWEAAVDAARETLREVAETSARNEDVPAPDELGDPAQLLRAVRSDAVVGIIVRGGRGPVDERRVTIWFKGDYLDDRAGALTA